VLQDCCAVMAMRWENPILPIHGIVREMAR
jgi:hypothetical protein